jgi:hypothetical protein
MKRQRRGHLSADLWILYKEIHGLHSHIREMSARTGLKIIKPSSLNSYVSLRQFFVSVLA